MQNSRAWLAKWIKRSLQYSLKIYVVAWCTGLSPADGKWYLSIRIESLIVELQLMWLISAWACGEIDCEFDFECDTKYGISYPLFMEPTIILIPWGSIWALWHIWLKTIVVHKMEEGLESCVQNVHDQNTFIPTP